MEARVNKMPLWYAVDGRGRGLVFSECPMRDEKWRTWLGHTEGCVSQVVSLMESGGVSLPPLRWEDEPVRLTLTLEVGR